MTADGIKGAGTIVFTVDWLTVNGNTSDGV
jgi:hypothetical protein